MQISFAVTAKLICAFVFTPWIVQFPFFLNLKFQSSSLLLNLYRPVCVAPGWKPQRQVFSHWGSNNISLISANIQLKLGVYRRELLKWQAPTQEVPKVQALLDPPVPRDLGDLKRLPVVLGKGLDQHLQSQLQGDKLDPQMF